MSAASPELHIELVALEGVQRNGQVNENDDDASPCVYSMSFLGMQGFPTPPRYSMIFLLFLKQNADNNVSGYS